MDKNNNKVYYKTKQHAFTEGKRLLVENLLLKAEEKFKEYNIAVDIRNAIIHKIQSL